MQHDLKGWFDVTIQLALRQGSRDLYVIELILASHPWLPPRMVVDFAILATFNHSQPVQSHTGLAPLGSVEVMNSYDLTLKKILSPRWKRGYWNNKLGEGTRRTINAAWMWCSPCRFYGNFKRVWLAKIIVTIRYTLHREGYNLKHAWIHPWSQVFRQKRVGNTSCFPSF